MIIINEFQRHGGRIVGILRARGVEHFGISESKVGGRGVR